MGWKRGCQPFSCLVSQNVMHCRKEVCSTCLSMESMPFVKSKPPLTRSLRFLRATARSTSSALWLDHAHPFVAAAEKRHVSCRCSLNVMHCRKEIYGTCSSKESMPFVKSKPPLPTRSLRFLRATVRSTSSA